jgi:Holliday junction resolvase RusA-like endonuclease
MTKTITLPNGRSYRVVGGAPAAPTAAKGKKRALRTPPLDGAAVASGTLTLTTTPPSVNALFYNRKSGGRGKTLVYRNWQRDALTELSLHPHWHVPGRVAVRIQVGAARGDIDNRVKATLDLLVRAGRIMDDRLVFSVKAKRAAIDGTVIEIEAAT